MQKMLSYNMCSPSIKTLMAKKLLGGYGWRQEPRTDFMLAEFLAALLLKLCEMNQDKCDENYEDAHVMKHLWGCWTQSFCIQKNRAYIVSQEALSSAAIHEQPRRQNSFQ